MKIIREKKNTSSWIKTTIKNRKVAVTSCGHWVAPEHLSASVCKSQCRILMFLQICNSVCLIMQKVPCVLVKISVSYLSASFKWWSTRATLSVWSPDTKQKSIQRCFLSKNSRNNFTKIPERNQVCPKATRPLIPTYPPETEPGGSLSPRPACSTERA